MAREGINRLTLDLPANLHRDLKVKAAQEGVSMRDLVEQWIRANLEQHHSKAAKADEALIPHG